jgi:outer membrane protein
VGYQNYLNSLTAVGLPRGALQQSSSTGDVGIRATIPLYQGGRPSAQIRQAQAREGQAMDNEIATERQVIANVRAAFSSYRAANEIIASTQRRWTRPSFRCAGCARKTAWATAPCSTFSTPSRN